MKGDRKRAWLLVILLGCFLLLLQAGCTRSGMTGRVRGRVDQDAETEKAREPDIGVDAGDSGDDIYDLEDEMSQEDAVIEPEELDEEIDPLPPDSFYVEDIEAGEKPGPGYDLGYRIQIFASGNLEGAEAVKKKVVAETAFSAYIDYEGGLYKVRVGNFPDRDSAAEARAGLAGKYPDCWIVRTTIRK